MFYDLCPRSFDQKNVIVHHIEKEHLKLRPFECKVCGLDFFVKNNLKAHMKRHGSKTKCKVCRKFVTNMNGHLKYHIIVKCTVCGKLYSKGSLNQHIKTQHKKKNSLN